MNTLAVFVLGNVSDSLEGIVDIKDGFLYVSREAVFSDEEVVKDSVFCE